VVTLPALEGWLVSGDDQIVGRDVVVLGGGKAGLSVADFCLRRGRRVSIVEPTSVFGVELGLPGRWRLVADLEAAGAALLDRTTFECIEPGVVRVRAADDTGDNALNAVVSADTVIVTDRRPDRGLADELTREGVRVHAVGDCCSLAGIEGANLAAAELAAALG
jgi:NADPH-dependent 2,4-dienoyl-CoA reductase/sulfur reductase-like enzyme